MRVLRVRVLRGCVHACACWCVVCCVHVRVCVACVFARVHVCTHMRMDVSLCVFKRVCVLFQFCVRAYVASVNVVMCVWVGVCV